MKTATTLFKASLAGLVISTGLLAAPALAQQQPQAGLPAPRIMVVEGARILRDSKAGKDIARQIQGLIKQADTEIKSRESGLRAEQTKMQQQGAILSASAKAQKQKEFEAKVKTLQQFVQNRQQLLQGAQYKAEGSFRKAADEAIQAVMKAKGANLILEKGSTVGGTAQLDMTNDVIKLLDQKLPALKVELAPLPKEVLAALQRQQQMQQQQMQQQQQR